MKIQIFLLAILTAETWSLKCYSRCEGQICSILSQNSSTNNDVESCEIGIDRCAVK